MAAEFHYQPLPSRRHIRVLELRMEDDETATLVGWLRDVDLDDVERIGYHAISYTWESQERTRDLQLGDSSSIIRITPNLDGALRQVRKDTRRIWADAICINQSDNEEKSSQIPLMADIFRHAARVLVWLGKEDGYIESMKILKTKSQRQPRFEKPDVVFEEEKLAAINMTKHPWFSRRWVVQEISVNHSASVLCGHIELSWLAFANMLSTYGQNVMSKDLLQHLSDWAFSLSVPGLERRGILSLLDTYAYTDCSEDRDRIFALLALANDVANHENENGIVFKPNYTQGTEDVYVSFAKACIQSGQSGRLFRAAVHRRPRTPKTLPSWVPDWGVSHGTFSGERYSQMDSKRCTNYFNATLEFLCTIKIPSSYTFIGQGSVMERNLDGWAYFQEGKPSLQTVIWKSKPFEGSNWRKWESDVMRELWNKVLATYPHLGANDESLQSAFCLLGACHSEGIEDIISYDPLKQWREREGTFARYDYGYAFPSIFAESPTTFFEPTGTRLAPLKWAPQDFNPGSAGEKTFCIILCKLDSPDDFCPEHSSAMYWDAYLSLGHATPGVETGDFVVTIRKDSISNAQVRFALREQNGIFQAPECTGDHQRDQPVYSITSQCYVDCLCWNTHEDTKSKRGNGTTRNPYTSDPYTSDLRLLRQYEGSVYPTISNPDVMTDWMSKDFQLI
ncbi:putative Heterokaryon incompatibility domain-containing protein [Seiridium unicorne]|uniref:Heterokaryon incompatibility domain-containing protein n=1 Tax=Seiridium unicorne TaxID=138068 RepID=A0ABR2UXQ6_9PEZI